MQRPSDEQRIDDAEPLSLARALVVAALVILLAGEVARLTIAADAADEDPELSHRLAPQSPETAAAMAMADVGRAAAAGEDPDAEAMRRLQALAGLSPLRPEPYLVKAALAERRGELTAAETLLRKARSLDPRSPAARYLLADVWLRQGQIVPALSEMALLARLMPATSVQLVPALAEFARAPGAREELGTILETNPKLRTPLLAALAADPDNADLVAALAGAEERSNETETLRWKSRLLKGLVSRGDYRQAHQLWLRFMGQSPNASDLLFNGNFRKVAAPEPFGWSFTSGGAGLAEPQDGSLRVLYYGRDNAILASQMLLLAPGTYVFAAPTNGSVEPSALHWQLSCNASKSALFELDLTARPGAVRFTIPPECQAQRLELVGTGTETPTDADVQIGPVTIARAGA